MELATKFSPPTIVHQSSTNDENRLEFEKLITSIQEDKLSSWEEEDISKIVLNRFKTKESRAKNYGAKKSKRFGAKKSQKRLEEERVPQF